MKKLRIDVWHPNSPPTPELWGHLRVGVSEFKDTIFPSLATCRGGGIQVQCLTAAVREDNWVVTDYSLMCFSRRHYCDWEGEEASSWSGLLCCLWRRVSQIWNGFDEISEQSRHFGSSCSASESLIFKQIQDSKKLKGSETVQDYSEVHKSWSKSC